ncbi:FAD-binding protein [Paenibacillus validus]|uniref:FAD-binding protein n=1 Tax=Paenibacillus validus TaxID=44253 RepID=UPI000FD6E5A7|nr:FAD-binding protein [Paenibacillus validus]MED4600763.1 FAD-binding protein [Paenibacillus validus]MED4606166.1 FAD-binding protein [Paenibacillus validus]
MSNERKIYSIKSDSLSKYKTSHYFENYGEIKSLDDYQYYIEWARQNNKKVYILGNGSNTLFTRKNIKSLVLKNSLPEEIKCISKEDNLYYISSRVMMNQVLSFCYKNSLESFYFLSSVPATIGGALAMNAGEGKKINKSIYDYVESVTYIDSDHSIKEINRRDMIIDYRKTMFTGCHDKLIVGAIFRFPKNDFGEGNPIKDRLKWSKAYQDNIAPNCGSVFLQGNYYIFKLLRGLKIGKTQYSSKTTNWINNKSSGPLPILILIFITRLIHFIFFSKCKIELISVK